MNTEPAVSDILAVFFARETSLVSGCRLERLWRAEATLRASIEREGERVLATANLSLLEAERVYDPSDACARTMRAHDLAFALPFCLDPVRLGGDRLDAQAFVRVVERLARFVVEHGLIDRHDLSCPLIELENQVARARHMLAQRVIRGETSGSTAS